MEYQVSSGGILKPKTEKKKKKKGPFNQTLYPSDMTVPIRSVA